MIPWLDDIDIEFPPIETALTEPDGLLCAGGNLSVETLLKAYRSGIFPWYSDPDPILWWSPDPRFIVKPSEIHISKSLQKIIRRKPFHISADVAFEEVILACAGPRNYTDGTWITPKMIDAYCRLHQAGYAHSVEVWQDNRLVGGLYGIALGCAFFGESMFSTVDNASKVGFILLAQTLDICGFELIDCQVNTKHLASLGAYEIERATFKLIIDHLINKQPKASPWDMLNL